MTDNQQDQPNQ